MRCRGPRSLWRSVGELVIYQGETQSEATTIHAQFPSSLQAGGAPATFTITLDNPSADPVPSARIDFSFFPGDGTKATVESNQLHLSYSTNGANGPFTDIALTGDTASGDDIEGYPGPLQGSTLPAHATETFTFHLNVDSSAPVEQDGHALRPSRPTSTRSTQPLARAPLWTTPTCRSFM